jgi:predicted Ser/Thr protein kinase
VRGVEYSRVRVDVGAKEVQLVGELARGGTSTVYRGLYGGTTVAVKKPRLATVADMDRYHKELQLLRQAAEQGRTLGAPQPPAVWSAHPPTLTHTAAPLHAAR